MSILFVRLNEMYGKKAKPIKKKPSKKK